MKKIVLLTFFLAVLETVASEPKSSREDTYKLGALHVIDGIKFENDQITSYRKGKLYGPTIYFTKDSNNICYVASQHYYLNNELQGSAIDFYPNGVVERLIVNIVQNTDYPELKSSYPYQSYCYEFYDTGKIKAEGFGLIEKDIMMGDSIRIGKWKYYDVDGVVSEVEYPREFDSIDGRWLF